MYEALICDEDHLKIATKKSPVKGIIHQINALNIAEAFVAIEKIINNQTDKLNAYGILKPIILDILDSNKQNKMVYSYHLGFVGLDKC